MLRFVTVISAAAVYAALPSVCSAQVNLVHNGEPAAVVVTADDPTPTAEYAAEELVTHVREATGATLPVAAESAIPEGYASRVFVGVTEAARAQGIDPENLALEETLLRVVGDDLYVLGSEAPDGNPLSATNSHSGTLFGVYEIAERYLGVVWAWPGELGRYVPQTDSLAIPAELDETFSPALRFRGIRWGYISRIAIHGEEYDANHKRIAFSQEGIERYGRDLQAYLRRHRMGRSEPKPPVGHYFSSWWERHGEQNPHWFMLNEEGERGPAPGRGTRHVAMCVSEPDLHRHLIEQWDGEGPLRLGEVDARDFCHCEQCLSWDAPQPEVLPPFLGEQERSFYRPLCVSDRYARFWKTIHDMALERNPEPLVTTFLYLNYFPAPVEVTELAPGIYGEFVPWGDAHIDFFPMREDAFEWLKQQWLGWADTGITMAYRPNYMHDGYTMPHLDTRQATEFFKFAFERGMIGTDFDSLTGQWATQGPKLYVHMRLNAKPELELEQMLDEYYSVFGPAAEHVREYFTYWEDYAVEHHQRIIDLFRDVGNRWQRFPIMAHEAYPPECFPPAEALLEAAAQAAGADPNPDYLARIHFLQAGLEHAKLCGRFAALFDGAYNIPRDSDRFARAQQVLQELVQFRRDHEHMYISDYAYGAAWREVRRWNINVLFEEVRGPALGEPLPDPWSDWQFRRDPDDRGVDEAWYEAVPENEEWEPVHVPAFLADTEVGAYLGYGWYSTTFTVPEDWQGNRLLLRFGSVDEQAWVYINGSYVGEHTVESEGIGVGALWNRPFTIEVEPDVIRFGEENHLVVRMHASTGMAGIWGGVGVHLPGED